jgi:hypothetical protein
MVILGQRSYRKNGASASATAASILEERLRSEAPLITSLMNRWCSWFWGMDGLGLGVGLLQDGFDSLVRQDRAVELFESRMPQRVSDITVGLGKTEIDTPGRARCFAGAWHGAAAGYRKDRAAGFVDERLGHTAAGGKSLAKAGAQVGPGEREKFLVWIEPVAGTISARRDLRERLIF